MHDSVLCPRADQPRRKLEIGEIQVELYRRECRKLNVTPVGAFIRSPSSPVLNIRHYSLGPGGALALSVPLTVSSSICVATELSVSLMEKKFTAVAAVVLLNVLGCPLTY